MNFDDMKNMLEMAENMRGKSAIDVISQSNPNFRNMQNVINNPQEMLSKMGVNGGTGGVDIATAMKMASKMQGGNGGRKNNNGGNIRKFYGLAPIAEFATPEIVYCLNKYLSVASNNSFK